MSRIGEDHIDDTEVLAQVISALRQLSPESRQRVHETVATFFGIGGVREGDRHRIADAAATPEPGLAFSPDRMPSPKQFLLDKQPRTDVERIACLAYYLTHYRDTPHYSTLELSKLNTEAAQRKFSNAADAVDNASQGGYLAPASRGQKQLSGIGERYVMVLPDYEAAKDIRSTMRSQHRPKKKSNGKA